ncbi:hypothetical protein KKI90_16910 [Xenorhabdus bovienii]|nr:hypothetical protein [Xenorhabdus bovienii]MDE9477766.1 hypothetical protein [Xenorhabdus bovienii]
MKLLSSSLPSHLSTISRFLSGSRSGRYLINVVGELVGGVVIDILST